MEINKSSCNYLVAFFFAALILSSMVAGAQRKLLDQDQVGSMETSESSTEQLQQEDEEVLVVALHGGRILRQVKNTNDYGTYDPSPTMAKPHFKDIPN
ncbi:uncharacterized protein LOC100831833 [Brachypodium distachyon]|uniref:Uncharacterized protein n=1 Tax=Brachypodium distachyon TaxID=15368 RepID=I1HE52_BRADI|nr:uncharacterized protein LOC100831833 [Brachypodium distachyon]KQK03721.1 hypothetical protein BRADI_2g09500v3 [Brachypodium distachyon]|eukprot:XP_003566612.1 uncharacterized protein LOC100831833 [Brachypodium distachyon]